MTKKITDMIEKLEKSKEVKVEMKKAGSVDDYVVRELVKSKYKRREGTPGNYKYFYDDAPGSKEGSSTENKDVSKIASQFKDYTPEELTKEILYREKAGDEYSRTVADELIKLRDSKKKSPKKEDSKVDLVTLHSEKAKHHKSKAEEALKREDYETAGVHLELAGHHAAEANKHADKKLKAADQKVKKQESKEDKGSSEIETHKKNILESLSQDGQMRYDDSSINLMIESNKKALESLIKEGKIVESSVYNGVPGYKLVSSKKEEGEIPAYSTEGGVIKEGRNIFENKKDSKEVTKHITEAGKHLAAGNKEKADEHIDMAHKTGKNIGMQASKVAEAIKHAHEAHKVVNAAQKKVDSAPKSEPEKKVDSFSKMMEHIRAGNKEGAHAEAKNAGVRASDVDRSLSNRESKDKRIKGAEVDSESHPGGLAAIEVAKKPMRDSTSFHKDTVSYSRSQLMEALGPSIQGKDKTKDEWHISVNGKKATIYDYKGSKDYHIGASSPEDSKAVKKWLDAHFAGQKKEEPVKKSFDDQMVDYLTKGKR